MTQETQTQEEDGPAGLREALKRSNAENAELREQVLTSHLSAIGLDRETGLGKVIYREYKGTFTAAEVAKYAKDEYSHEYTPPEPTPEVEEVPEVPEPNPQAETIVDALAQIDQANATSTPAEPQLGDDSIEAHDKRLADPEARRPDAINAIVAKTKAFKKQHGLP